jgi:hypothetical protein
MGASASNQSLTSTQKVSNTMIQASHQTCNATCNSSLSNLTIIEIGGEGNINIKQQCAIDNVDCIMKASFDQQLQNTLDSMLQQSATAMSAGFNLNFAATNQKTNLNQIIQNSTTQIMDSSCNFTADNNMDNLYFYVQDHKGDINISQTATISNSSCNMDNAAKNTVYNASSTKATQTSKIAQLGAMGMIFVVVILMIIVGAIVMIVSHFSSAAGKIGSGSGGHDNSVERYQAQQYILQQERNNQQQSASNTLVNSVVSRQGFNGLLDAGLAGATKYAKKTAAKA